MSYLNPDNVDWSNVIAESDHSDWKVQLLTNNPPSITFALELLTNNPKAITPYE